MVPLFAKKMSSSSCFCGKFIRSIIHMFLRRFIKLLQKFYRYLKLLVKVMYVLEATWLIWRYIMDAASVSNLE